MCLAFIYIFGRSKTSFSSGSLNSGANPGSKTLWNLLRAPILVRAEGKAELLAIISSVLKTSGDAEIFRFEKATKYTACSQPATLFWPWRQKTPLEPRPTRGSKSVMGRITKQILPFPIHLDRLLGEAPSLRLQVGRAWRWKSFTVPIMGDPFLCPPPSISCSSIDSLVVGRERKGY